MATKPPMKDMAINAKNGQIVSKQYAKTHPASTVVMKVPAVKAGKGK
jgi:hypothetical protein